LLLANAFMARQAGAQLPSTTTRTGSASINIRIYAADGRPLDLPAQVALSSESGAFGSLRAVTENGVARFNGLAPGAYDIEVTIPGYKNGIGQVSTMQFGTSDASITMEVSEDPATAVGAKGMYLAPKARKELELGKVAQQKKDYDQAEQHFLAAYKLAPGDPEVNDALGVLYLAKKDLPKAEDYLLRSVSIESDNPGSQIDLGQLRITQMNFKAAQGPLERAVTLAPKNFLAHWLLGVAYLDSKQYEEARAEANIAIKVKDGAVSQGEYLLGQALAALGRNAEAIAALQVYVNGLPNDFYVPSANRLIAKLQSAPAQAAPGIAPPPVSDIPAAPSTAQAR
jgi:Flp pilus assembly protein TadD